MQGAGAVPGGPAVPGRRAGTRAGAVGAAAAAGERPRYLLVETQGRWGAPSGTRFLRTARLLAGGGAPTVVFLVEDGVSSAVGAPAGVPELLAAGATVWADEVSLAQRALAPEALGAGVEAVGMDAVAPLLLDPDVRVVWH